MKNYIIFFVIICSFISNILNSSTNSNGLKNKAGKVIETGADYALESDVIPLPVKVAVGAGKL